MINNNITLNIFKIIICKSNLIMFHHKIKIYLYLIKINNLIKKYHNLIINYNISNYNTDN
jgi:hypothetical protein